MAMRLRETPVPIPNTMVKTQAAEDTMLGTAWESRWLPDPFESVAGDRSAWGKTGAAVAGNS